MHDQNAKKINVQDDFGTFRFVAGSIQMPKTLCTEEFRHLPAEEGGAVKIDVWRTPGAYPFLTGDRWRIPPLLAPISWPLQTILLKDFLSN